ncbi:MAG: multi-sensor hybrid histidine kinase [Acidobacteria bacterium]|nr:multi-sensor hybrid histidine kinase [Acidobacteriota bacterium]
MLSAKSKVSQSATQHSFVPYFTLLLSLVITLAFALYVHRSVRARDQARFNSGVQDLTTFLRGRPRLYVEALRAATGLFAVNPSIKPGAFHKFVERLELAEQYPGAGGIGFLARVTRNQKQSFSATMRQEGLKDFQISPENGQAEYHPVIYFESLDQRNQPALGYDMSTDSVLRAAMESARDTGLPTASGRVMLKGGGNDVPGFFIYVPIYRNDDTPRSVDLRRETHSGFVYAQFRAADLIGSILATRNFGAIDMRIYDAALPAPESLLHETAAADIGNEPANRLKAASTVDVAGRTWFVAFAARPEFYSSSWGVYFTALSGLFVGLVLFALTRSQVLAGRAAERAASELRISESRVRNTLSDRERAEEALRESEERYRELVENANDIIYTLDLTGNVTSVNKAAESICGYTREEMLKMNLTTLLTAESAAAGIHMLDRKLGGEERTNYEVDARAKDGTIVTLEISSRLVSQAGQPFGVQGVARDITKRRLAEEALREADQRALTEYERLLERISGLAQALGTARDLQAIYSGLREFSLASVPCNGFFVSLYDPARDVRTASYGWGDGLELDVSELPPMPITAEGPNSRAVRTGEIIITDNYMSAARTHPVVIVGPENGLRPQSSLAAPMAVMGRIIGTIEVQSYERAAYKEGHITAMRMASNLTAVAIENVRLLEQESRARAAAEESNRLKDEFLATVSHELRTPLTAILGWARMLETGLDPETAARAIETIRRNASSQSQIIDDILDVSRIITGNLYLDLQPLELAPIVEAAINVVRPTAEAKGIEIEAQFDSQPTLVLGDANRLQQVIWNLLSNAIKFTPSGGQVQISVIHAESFAELRVKDNGQGITPEFLPFVFDRFRQADSTTTRRHGGLGLGLAIVRHLVEIHGGSVRAESEGPEKGANFTVRLPVVTTHTRPSPKPDMFEIVEMENARILSGLQVLVVDDDADTLEVIAAALSGGDATVTSAPSVEEALARIKESRPDVIVSDIAMPLHDGYELIEQLRALDNNQLPFIPAVAITAYARAEDRERALLAGYQQYLAKPVEPLELIAILAKLAGRTVSDGNGKVK